MRDRTSGLTGGFPEARETARPDARPDGRTRARAGARSISLRRLGLVFLLCLGLGLSAVVTGILLFNARNATREEVNTAYGLALAYLDEFRGRLVIGPSPMEEALGFSRQINVMRHVRAEVRGTDGHLLAPRGPEPEASEAPPEWFLNLVAGEPREALAPIGRYPDGLGAVVLATDYRDEAAEIWRDLSAVLGVILGVCAVASLATFLILHLVHRRLRACDRVLRAIRAGDFAAPPPPRGIAELDDLADGIGALASDLDAREAENRLLQQRLMTLSDSERRQVASDLHDGLGPLLFALRTAVSEARGIAGRSGEVAAGGAARGAGAGGATGATGAETGDLLGELDAVAAHAEALRGMVRGVIYRLRPMIEADASLADLLADFAAGFAEVAPETVVRLDLGPGTHTACGETAGLAILRFAQESALNAVRHGGASEIVVAASVERRPDGRRWVEIDLGDDGQGPAPGALPSYGQAGILDRARALGGEYRRPGRRGGWTWTRLSLPLAGFDVMSAA